jgi:HesB-like selenoprotein
MRITIDDNTKASLSKALQEREKEAVRIAIKGFGWGGPTFGVVLDEQKEDDDVFVVDEIKVVAEKEFSFLFDDTKIVETKGYFGNSFNVITGRDSGSC